MSDYPARQSERIMPPVWHMTADLADNYPFGGQKFPNELIKAQEESMDCSLQPAISYASVFTSMAVARARAPVRG